MSRIVLYRRTSSCIPGSALFNEPAATKMLFSGHRFAMNKRTEWEIAKTKNRKCQQYKIKPNLFVFLKP
jgi:hypothetical protein